MQGTENGLMHRTLIGKGEKVKCAKCRVHKSLLQQTIFSALYATVDSTISLFLEGVEWSGPLCPLGFDVMERYRPGFWFIGTDLQKLVKLMKADGFQRYSIDEGGLTEFSEDIGRNCNNQPFAFWDLFTIDKLKWIVRINKNVEVVGNILSRLGAARNVVIASATCRKWQEAWRNHLHTLTFNSNDWPLYHEFSTNEFSAAPVIAWLMYTRETLRQLHYNYISLGSESPAYACPKIEVLTLVSLDVVMSDPQAVMELATNSLKHIYVEAISLDKFILEADSLEKLHLKDCTLEVLS
ncbi:F-box/LRR-repeat protein [Sesamum angolense]|uniref:F-box/LRR-repeat protein n=1 Tax=Sesamum angolense TaxID=2727404 RepID=A0AAE2BNR6_9LAMI|nr:F-box/LRR-repeat protein [Sesamum angolense]